MPKVPDINFDDVIFGLKLFSNICVKQTGDCFYAADIRVAFTDAPKLYAPPADEISYFLPDDQKTPSLQFMPNWKSLDVSPILKGNT